MDEEDRPPHDSEWLSFRLSPADQGRRLDVVLRERLPHLGRRALRLLFERGQVRANGLRARKGGLARDGDELFVLGATSPGAALPAPEIDLLVCLETDEFVVVDKPAGVPSAATLEHPGGTLAGALLARFPEMSGVGFSRAEPGLVHRLDTQTSGLLLAAKTAEAHAHFAQELSRGRLQKTYLAICPSPRADEFDFDRGLMPDPDDTRRVALAAPGTSPARHTHCRVKERGREYSLLQVELRRGYRHQIRAHLASAGLPLVGDLLYGGRDVGWGQRQALHASQITAVGPSGATFGVESPLPEDLRSLWAELATGARKF